MKVEYGCLSCIKLAEAKGLKEWPLYPRNQVKPIGNRYYCLKHYRKSILLLETCDCE